MPLVETHPHGATPGIVELRLARPPVNALNPALCEALTAAIEEALAGGARGLVLSSSAQPDRPLVFSAGLDVPFLLSLGEDRDALRQAWEAFFAAARALAACPVPVAAALPGHAPAGGCVLALCCDYRVMAESPDPARPLRIGLNETQVGLAVPPGVQQLLRRVVGAHRAERLLVAGEMVDASRALALGLVDELAPIEAVAQRAVQWLAATLALPSAAMLHTRSIARADLAAALAPANIALDVFLDAWYADGTQQALRALVARLGK